MWWNYVADWCIGNKGHGMEILWSIVFLLMELKMFLASTKSSSSVSFFWNKSHIARMAASAPVSWPVHTSRVYSEKCALYLDKFNKVSEVSQGLFFTLLLKQKDALGLRLQKGWNQRRMQNPLNHLGCSFLRK